jgi:hypothetical protein
MGVAWFLREAPASVCGAKADAEPDEEDTSSSSAPTDSSVVACSGGGGGASALCQSVTTRRRRSRQKSVETLEVDVIDIEDEDHSFASFFVDIKPNHGGAGSRQHKFKKNKYEVHLRS